MAYTVIQSGDTLKLMDESGVLTNLTLPAGVTLRENVKPRWAVFDRYVVLVNTPDQPLIVDASGVVRVLTPKPPRVAATVTNENGGALSGTYAGIRYTFLTTDDEGNIISESDYSPPSGSATLTTDFLKADHLDVSDQSISARRLYRPTSGGATLFPWVDLDGNVLDEIQDDLSDAGLSLVESPILGTPPYLTHIASFRGRMFGAGPNDLDHVRYTEAGIRYAWPEDNLLEIPVVGSDDVGITAFLQRREALGVGRQNQLVQITGTGTEDATLGSIDFDVVIVAKELGITSQESVDVWRDVGHFLWQDGVYQWGPDGIVCLSDGSADGKGNVRTWFTTDDYFDRNRFNEAFGQIDPITQKYRLYLYDPDGALWWVEFDLRDRTWWGPHKTNLFVPSSAFIVQMANIRTPSVGGANGHVYQQQAARVDGTSTAIPFQVIGKRHDFELPDVAKHFGRISVLTKGDQASGTLTVTSRVGALDQDTGPQVKSQYHALTKPHSTLGRLGVGQHAQIEFTHEKAGEKVELLGYDIDPVHAIGRRGHL